jgi:uncharacterized iron-regulated membrane protein
MTLLQRIVRQPQGVWARKALFQVHLWTGIGIGLYIFVISISGSAIVFRREIARLAWSSPTVVQTGQILTTQEISAIAKKAYPRNEVAKVTFSKKPDRAAEVLMTRGQRQVERAFNPYTGKDLGPVGTDEPRILYWLVQFHDDLLGGHTGRRYNGAGALLLTVLCATGLLIWWPGVTRWWRSLILRRKAGWARFNWDLHSAVGFWMFAFVLMWGISGIYLSYPEPFTNLVDYLQPLDPNSRDTRTGDEVLAWLARIHFGRAYGTSVKWLWTLLGFVPVILFVTGAIMWWNRVLSPEMRKSRRATPATTAGLQPEVSSVQSSDLELEA